VPKPHQLHLRKRDPGPTGEQTRDRITRPLSRRDTLARLAPDLMRTETAIPRPVILLNALQAIFASVF
jgi:hypothetical protein